MSRREERQRRELLQDLTAYKEAATVAVVIIREMENEINLTRELVLEALRDPRDTVAISRIVANLSPGGREAIELAFGEVLDAAQ